MIGDSIEVLDEETQRMRLDTVTRVRTVDVKLFRKMAREVKT